MATLTTNDIKTIDELASMSGEALANEDSFLAFDKDMNCHKKISVTAFKAWMTSAAGEAEESAQESAASATAAAASANSAASSATDAATSASAAAASASGAAADAQSASSSATDAATSASAAATSEANAMDSETASRTEATNAANAASRAAQSATAATSSETNAASSATSAASSATDAASSATAAASSASDAGDGATLAESWAVGGTNTRTGEDTDNSKYYSQQAAASATSAAESSSSATEALSEIQDLFDDVVFAGARIVVVDETATESADVNTIFRIQDTAVLTVSDSLGYGTEITLLNETNAAQSVTLTLSGGSSTISVLAGEMKQYIWTGFWREQASGGGGGVERRVVVVDETATESADVDTIFRIQDDAVLTVSNSSVFGTWMAIVNETQSAQSVALLTAEGSETLSIPAGDMKQYIWVNYWREQEFGGGGGSVGGDTPIGSVISYLGNTAPEGWLMLQGQTISRLEYNSLLRWATDNELIGTGKPFGVGDGTTTFVLPDLRGEFLRGAGNNSHANQGNGGTVGQHQDATLESTFGRSSNADLGGIGYVGVGNNTAFNYDSERTSTAFRYIAGGASGADTTPFLHTSRPTNTSVNWIIKAREHTSSGGSYPEELVIGASTIRKGTITLYGSCNGATTELYSDVVFSDPMPDDDYDVNIEPANHGQFQTQNIPFHVKNKTKNGFRVSAIWTAAGDVYELLRYTAFKLVTDAGIEELKQANNYSTTEKAVGTWYDGKTIYRKVFVDTIGVDGSTTRSLATGIPAGIINDLITFKTTFRDTNARTYWWGTDWVGAPSATTLPSTVNVYLNSNGAAFAINNYGDWPATSRMIIILEYTKSTD